MPVRQKLVALEGRAPILLDLMDNSFEVTDLLAASV